MRCVRGNYIIAVRCAEQIVSSVIDYQVDPRIREDVLTFLDEVLVCLDHFRRYLDGVYLLQIVSGHRTGSNTGTKGYYKHVLMIRMQEERQMAQHAKGTKYGVVRRHFVYAVHDQQLVTGVVLHNSDCRGGSFVIREEFLPLIHRLVTGARDDDRPCKNGCQHHRADRRRPLHSVFGEAGGKCRDRSKRHVYCNDEQHAFCYPDHRNEDKSGYE